MIHQTKNYEHTMTRCFSVGLREKIQIGNMTKPSWLALLIFINLLTSCTKLAEETTESEAPTDQITLTSEQTKTFGIEMGSFQNKTLHEYVKANGALEAVPQSTASVSFPIMGYVKTIGVEIGQNVKQGQILANLESLELVQLQQDYQQIVSKLRFQEQELQRQKTLDVEEVGAKRKLQQAEADHNASKSMVIALETKLKMVGVSPNSSVVKSGVSVVSPIAGFVKAIHVNIGKTVNSTDVLFEIVGGQHAHFALKVFEKDAPKIKIGQSFTIEGQTLNCKVSSINKFFDASTRTIEVIGEANTQSLILGQYITAKIDVGNRSAQTLPESAIVRKGELSYIFIERQPLHYERILVKLGYEENGFIEIEPEEKNVYKASNLINVRASKIVIKGVQLLEAELMKGVGEEE
jgi:membrane fusion protein, heavy metal efflux system